MRVDWQTSADTLQIEGRTCTLPGPVDQVLEWPGQPRVAVLLARSAGRARLLVLDADGDTLAHLAPPGEFELYYLQFDASRGITAICTTDTPIHGWTDWQFSICVERGVLERFSPAR